MKIGIDIDDTISKTREYVINSARHYNNLIYGKTYENPNEKKLINMFNWTQEQNDRFFEENLKTILSNVDVVENAKEIINKLYYEGNEIIIITARNYDYKDPLEVSKKWLDKHGFKYNKIYVDSIDKWIVCEDEGIDLFIDDNKENCINVSNKNFKTIWYTNSIEKITNIINIGDWKEIYNYIYKLKD